MWKVDPSYGDRYLIPRDIPPQSWTSYSNPIPHRCDASCANTSLPLPTTEPCPNSSDTPSWKTSTGPAKLSTPPDNDVTQKPCRQNPAPLTTMRVRLATAPPTSDAPAEQTTLWRAALNRRRRPVGCGRTGLAEQRPGRPVLPHVQGATSAPRVTGKSPTPSTHRDHGVQDRCKRHRFGPRGRLKTVSTTCAMWCRGRRPGSGRGRLRARRSGIAGCSSVAHSPARPSHLSLKVTAPGWAYLTLPRSGATVPDHRCPRHHAFRACRSPPPGEYDAASLASDSPHTSRSPLPHKPMQAIPIGGGSAQHVVAQGRNEQAGSVS